MNKRGINVMKIASVAKLPLCSQKHQNRRVLNNVWTLFLPNKNSALQGDWWHDGNTTLWSEASVNNSRCGSWRYQSVTEKGETWISPESSVHSGGTEWSWTYWTSSAFSCSPAVWTRQISGDEEASIWLFLNIFLPRERQKDRAMALLESPGGN